MNAELGDRGTLSPGAPGGPPCAVELDSVNFVFGASRNSAPVKALDDVSFVVTQGDICCILGPSGCGKSTLLKLVAGFVPATSGRLTAGGQEVRGTSPDRLMVFQRPAVFPWLTIRKNLLFGLGPRRRSMRGRLEAERDRRLIEMAETVGLESFLERYPYELSGGMLQRLQLARSLICEPAMLLLDEPFGALDAQTRLEMQELLQRVWHRTRPTILFVTHDVEEALFLADQVIVMSPRPGRVCESLVNELPRPRTVETLTTDKFVEAKRAVLRQLRPNPSAVEAETRMSDRIAGGAS